MTESNNISLFEEEDGSGKMDKKEDVFEHFADYEGYIFTYSEIAKLGNVELEAFRRALRMGQVKFIAGTNKGRIVNKKRLKALGLDMTTQYYQFVKGWKDPGDVELERVLEEKRHRRYWDIRVYADTIDGRVDEAEKAKDRKLIRQIDYEMDDDRGWTKVTKEEHRKAYGRAKRQKGPSEISEDDWEDKKEESK